MSQLLSYLANSPTFFAILFFWLLLSFGWKESRRELLFRLRDLVLKPPIFETDNEPRSYPFYPRLSFELIAADFRRAITLPLRSIILQFKEWVWFELKLVYKPERPLRIIGYVLYLVILILFLWADAIAIVNTLAALNLITSNVPAFLSNFEVAVLMGSLGTFVVAGLISTDIQEKSVFSNWEDQSGMWKYIAKTMTGTMIVTALVVTIFAGVQRLTLAGYFPEETRVLLNSLTAVAIYIVAPMNTVLVTLLIAFDATLGAVVVFIAAQALVLANLILTRYLAEILGYLLPLSLDVIYRLILMILDLTLYVTLTPIDLILSLVISQFRSRQDISMESRESGNEDKLDNKGT